MKSFGTCTKNLQIPNLIKKLDENHQKRKKYKNKKAIKYTKNLRRSTNDMPIYAYGKNLHNIFFN